MRDSIIFATASFLVPFSSYLASAIAAACSLAVVVWGIQIMMGQRGAPQRDGIILGIKIAFIITFTANFGGYFPTILDMLEGMLNGISLTAFRILDTSSCVILNHGGGSETNILNVWDLVDCSVEQLIGGIFSPFTLSFSLVGFLVGALLSSAMGFFIAMIGFFLIGMTLFAIARALYVFITAYIAFAIMVIISPIFIPLMLFQYTKKYFENWLRLTVGFLLQPLFLFAFLIMFLAAFNVSVYKGPHSLYYAIAGEASQSPGFKIGKWLINNGVYSEQSIGERFINVDPKGNNKKNGDPGAVDQGATGVNGEIALKLDTWKNKLISDQLGVGKGTASGPELNFFKTKIPILAIDWKMLAKAANPSGYSTAFSGGSGGDAVASFNRAYLLNIFLSFIMALVSMYIFYSMLEYLPFIGSGIASGGMNMPAFGAGKFAPPGNSMFGGKK